MLSKNDIATLHGMFGKLLRENNEVFGRELKRDVRDEIHSVVNGAVSASEQRMTEHMDVVEQRMIARIDDGQSAILEAIDELVLPRIKKNRRSILRLNKTIGIA
jgi:hypothetical protein